MKIKVSQSNINNGYRKDCSACPIALACVDAGIIEPSVGTERLSYLTTEHYSRSIYLPVEAQNFIYKFDNRLNVTPFEFDIDI